VDLGIRFDTVKFDIEQTSYYELKYWPGYYYSKLDTPVKETASKTWNYVSPRIGVVYKFVPNFSVYGTISTGFQTPQDSELLTNPNLDASTTINYEVGARSVGNRYYVSTALFYMITDKEIVQTYDNGERVYVNAGKTHKKGFELEGNFEVINKVFLGASYTYYDFKYKDFVFQDRDGNIYNFSDKKMRYIPEYMYSIYLMGKKLFGGFKFRVEVNTWGPYYVDNANTEKYSDFKNITNVMVGYESGNRWDVSLYVRNLFDKKYAAEYIKDDTSGEYYIYPAPPRTYLLSASYKF
jgi:iron complex outermembrane receptor protein